MNEAPNVQPEIDQLYQVAQDAAAKFSVFDTHKTESIVQAVVAAAEAKAEFYAQWAVEETGYGNAEDKVAKNLATSVGLKETYDISEYVDPVIDYERKLIRIPKPAGVVLAPMPCTNPIMTVNFKVIANLVARNAVILCPHPAAKECSSHAAHYLADVAEKAGAPKGAVQVLEEPSIQLVNLLMQDPRTALIMATGGPGLVHAAYSSGNPAVGVGAGNVAAYVDTTASIEKAGADLIIGNSFDYGLPCTCESVVLAEREISERLKAAMVAGNGWFVGVEDEQPLRDFLFPNGVNNPEALGKSAQWIGEQVGISIPENVKSIVFELKEIGPDEPVSKEKMFPVLGFYIVEGGVDAGIVAALAMLDMMGKGHSAVLHTEDPKAVAKYTAALPVCRISINTPGMTGNAGLSTNLPETGAVGTGFFGGSSTSENIGPKHLVQYTYIAYDSDPSVEMGDIETALAS